MKNFNLPSAVFGALAVIGLLSLLSSSHAPEKTVASDRWEHSEFINSKSSFWCVLGKANYSMKFAYEIGEAPTDLPMEYKVTWTDHESGVTETKKMLGKHHVPALFLELKNSYFNAMGDKGWQCFQHTSYEGPDETYFFRRKI